MPKPISASFLGLAFVLAMGHGSLAAEPSSSIHGMLYVSPAGDLSYDVMLGRAVEIRLLRSERDLLEEFRMFKEGRLPAIREQEATALKTEDAFRQARGTDREKAAAEQWKLEGTKLEKLRVEYEKAIDGLMSRNTLSRARTDAEGRFRFGSLLPGRYYLQARFEVATTGIRYFWLSPVELTDGEDREVLLNKPAAVSVYD